jgi:hypothetical protein
MMNRQRAILAASGDARYAAFASGSSVARTRVAVINMAATPDGGGAINDEYPAKLFRIITVIVETQVLQYPVSSFS